MDGYYIVKNEDFVYNPRISTSAPVGPINRNKLGRTGVMSPLYTVFRPHDIDTTYLEYFFKCGYWHSFMNFNGDSGARSDRFSIRDNVFFQMPIPIPDIDEQRKIGELLTCLDNLITLHQRKFEKLTNVKKSMLEKMFPQNGSSYPEIRFKGFTDPWEQRKLSEMCGTFEYGLNAAAKEFDGKNKYIRITDIDDVSREFLLSDLSSPDICLDGMSKYLLSSGDVVFARTGASVGKTYIYRENDGIVYFAGFLIRAKVNQDNDAEFVFQSTLSPSYEKYIRITSQRSGQPGVNAQEYSEYDLFAPSKEEQQRIGHFLRGIDHLITLHQRQPFLHSPPDISLIVQLTPPFYTFSWEQRKLSDLAEKTYGGGTPSTSNEAYWNGDIPWIQSSDVVDGKLLGVEPRKWITQDGLNNSAAQLIPGNSIAIITRVGVGKLAFMPYSYTTSQDFLSLSKLNAEPLFTVYACYKKLQTELNAVQGTSIKGITKDELLAKNIMVPRYAEQQQIGAFFKQLDHLITLHQRQTIVYAVIRSIRKVILAERQYFAPPMLRKSPLITLCE